MLLSEAMRIGASLTKRVTGQYYMCSDDGMITGTCAVGAVMVGYHGSLKRTDIHRRASGFVEAESIEAECPECSGPYVLAIIDHLHDVHNWTRERIADWLVSSGLDREIGAKEEVHEESPLVLTRE